MSFCYHVVTTLMVDCLRTDELSQNMTNNKVNSAFHPFGVGKSSTSLSGLDYGQGAFTCFGWQVTRTLCDST